MTRIAPAWLLCLMLLGCPSAAGAQDLRSAAAPPLLTLQFSDTSVAQALRLLFNNAHVSFLLPPDLPDTKITLDVKDQPFMNALKLILQAGSTDQVRLTYTVEEDVVHIFARRMGLQPAPDEPPIRGKIRLAHIDPAVAAAAVRPLLTADSGSIGVSPNDNSLLFQGSRRTFVAIADTLHSIDVAPDTIVVVADVFQQGGHGAKKRLLSTTIRTLQNQEATTEETTGGVPAGQAARLHIRLRSRKTAADTIFVESGWDVSLPLATTGPRPSKVRLEKRLTTSTELKSGKPVVVGEVSGAQWGGSGHIYLELTAWSLRN